MEKKLYKVESLLSILCMSKKYHRYLFLYAIICLGLYVYNGITATSHTALKVFGISCQLLFIHSLLGFPRGDERLVLLQLRSLRFGVFLAMAVLLAIDILQSMALRIGQLDTGDYFLGVTALGAIGYYAAATIRDRSDEEPG